MNIVSAYHVSGGNGSFIQVQTDNGQVFYADTVDGDTNVEGMTADEANAYLFEQANEAGNWADKPLAGDFSAEEMEEYVQ